MTDFHSYYFNPKQVQCKPELGFHLVALRKPCVKLITFNEWHAFFVSFPCFKNEASSLLNKSFEKSDSIVQSVHGFPYFVIFSLTLKSLLPHYTYILDLFSVHFIYLSIYLSIPQPSIICLPIHYIYILFIFYLSPIFFSCYLSTAQFFFFITRNFISW